MIELHQVSIGQHIKSLSLTVEDGGLVCISGSKGSGKTTLLRAIMGFIPIDGGHISIDGELLTPLSAPWFRRFTAYVPQHLSMPDGCRMEGFEQWADSSADERYLMLLTRAVRSKKPLLIVDEPASALPMEMADKVDCLLREAQQQGATVVAVNDRLTDEGNVITLNAQFSE